MIVFSDFDKTLRPSSDEAGFRRNLESIQEFRQRGNLFCLATGRSEGSLARTWPEYRGYLDYMILDNGAICLSQKGEMMFQEVVALATAQEIAAKIVAKGGEIVKECD